MEKDLSGWVERWGRWIGLTMTIIEGMDEGWYKLIPLTKLIKIGE